MTFEGATEAVEQALTLKAIIIEKSILCPLSKTRISLSSDNLKREI